MCASHDLFSARRSHPLRRGTRGTTSTDVKTVYMKLMIYCEAPTTLQDQYVRCSSGASPAYFLDRYLDGVQSNNK